MSLKDFLLSPRGRVSRSRFWLAACLYVLGAGIVSALVFVLWQIIPGEEVDGEFKVNGAKSLPYLLLVFGYLIFCVWSGICVGIKRYHDRDKSGAWLLIQFVPVIGGLWYLIEAGFLAGTRGSNRYGAQPGPDGALA